MFYLIGFVCFFSSQTCTQPVRIAKPFSTHAECNAFKDQISAKSDPADWIDVKMECVEAKEVL